VNDIIVIGAGVAGLTLARELKQAGRDVLILEKSRGLAGRSATRTLYGNRVDHGAQYFTVRDERFQKQVYDWLAQGHLKIWSHGFHRLTDKGLVPPSQGNPRYVFPKGMNTIGKLLGEGINVQTETKVMSIVIKGDAWLISSETGETFEAKTVILNMPPEQALALCPFDLGTVKGQLERVVMEPNFSLMLGFEASLAPHWQGVLVETSSPISWLAHDSTKREDAKEVTLVVHSTPAFARENFDQELDIVKGKLLAEFIKLRAMNRHLFPKPQTLNPDPLFPLPLWVDLQRWKYALASTFLEVPFVQHSETFYFCGDWCGGARLEAAYLSGLALAEKLHT
jgi:renalase